MYTSGSVPPLTVLKNITACLNSHASACTYEKHKDTTALKRLKATSYKVDLSAYHNFESWPKTKVTKPLTH